jgi:hypothetical protein
MKILKNILILAVMAMGLSLGHQLTRVLSWVTIGQAGARRCSRHVPIKRAILFRKDIWKLDLRT